MKTSSSNFILGLLMALLPMVSCAQKSSKLPLVSAETLKQWSDDLSNWGRWGTDDQMGTLNLITPENRIQAAALVKEGKTVSLALNLDKEKSINNGDPLIHKMANFGPWASDTYTINYHGYAHSHLDALCHMAHQGKLYNGFSDESRQNSGAEKLGVEHMKNGIVTRGILVDMPWLKGIPYLEPGTPITSEDLEAFEAKAGLKVGSGDVLLIRTGVRECERQNGLWKYSDKAAGLHASTVKWLKDRDVAVLGSDGASDVFPSGVEGQTHPVHQLVLIALGTPILDNLNLEDVAAEAINLNRWEFMFVGAPLRIKGGTGSPLNPLAIF